MPPASPGPTPAPVAAGARIQALDIIRGFALLGVLLMNLDFFSGYAYREAAGVHAAVSPAGLGLLAVRDWLLAGKSIALFSMLFGVGLAIQMERARARGAGLGRFALRRLGSLALLGAAHAVLVWNGDILHIYALGGLLILPFLGRRPWAPLAGAAAVFLLGVARDPLQGWLGLPPEFFWDTWQDRAQGLMVQADRAFGARSWLAAARFRVWEWLAQGPFFLVHYLLTCLPLFLGGMALWQAGLLSRPRDHLRALRVGFHATFWPGLALTWRFPAMARLGGDDGGLLALVLGDLGAYALAVAYLLGLLALLQRPGWQARLGILAPLGRMALTNYLAQSLVGVWVFNRHGLGLWHRVDPAAWLTGGCLLFALQVAWSRWWLARFRFGPVEWLWRVMTYGRREPFRAG